MTQSYCHRVYIRGISWLIGVNYIKTLARFLYGCPTIRYDGLTLSADACTVYDDVTMIAHDRTMTVVCLSSILVGMIYVSYRLQ